MGLSEWARKQAAEYSNGADRPLGGYLTMISIYGSGVAALFGAGRLAGKRLPKQVSAGDIALLAVATNQLARTIAKDPITSPFRAPFTRFEGVAGPATLSEQVRGHGLQHSVGEMLSCPLCLAQWVATGLTAGTVFAPRVTRLVMVVMAGIWGADVAQYAVSYLEKQAEG